MENNAAFTPILTAEDFEAAVAERVTALTTQLTEKETMLETQAAQLTASNNRIAELMNAETSELFAAEREAHAAQIADYTERLQAAEKLNMRVQFAIENEYSLDFVDRLRGNTVEELRKDARALERVFYNEKILNNPPAPPMGSAEPVLTKFYDSYYETPEERRSNEALKVTLRQMKGEDYIDY